MPALPCRRNTRDRTCTSNMTITPRSPPPPAGRAPPTALAKPATDARYDRGRDWEACRKKERVGPGGWERLEETQPSWKPMTCGCNTKRYISTNIRLNRSARYDVTRSLEAARLAHRTTPSAAPQTASPVSLGLAAIPRASRARTRACARTLTFCRSSSRTRA
jgi:hypothetical protein